MQTRININGLITTPEDAKISVLDHGLLFGDSVYETLRTYQGKPFLFSRHFARLQHSAQALHLDLPWSREETHKQIRGTLLPGECRIRLVVTRGVGALAADPETCADPSTIIIVVPLVAMSPEVYSDGVEVTISSVRRSQHMADIKSGSLIHQVLAAREAKHKRVFEAILLTANEQLSDGITSNVYIVRDEKLMTPSHDAGIVEGITRGVILELARRMGFPVIEGLFPVSEIHKADEMFLTSSTREVVPIVRIDGNAVADGRPGPVTTRLLEAYRSEVQRLLAED
jgi:branched-chain amino acid aminotransferase